MIASLATVNAYLPLNAFPASAKIVKVFPSVDREAFNESVVPKAVAESIAAIANTPSFNVSVESITVDADTVLLKVTFN